MRESAPRLNVELTEEQDRQLRELIPWGMKKYLFSAIVDEVIEMLKKHGEIAIPMIVSKKLKFLNIIGKVGNETGGFENKYQEHE